MALVSLVARPAGFLTLDPSSLSLVDPFLVMYSLMDLT